MLNLATNDLRPCFDGVPPGFGSDADLGRFPLLGNVLYARFAEVDGVVAVLGGVLGGVEKAELSENLLGYVLGLPLFEPGDT